jgi:putative tricarboxylic transport membrane protein
MAETLGFLLQGFSIAFAPKALLFALIGAVLGTITGVLPGIGPASAIAILLPIVASGAGDPVLGIIMLAGIYYGAMYGGSTTAILVNIPGEVASVVTCLDGYKLAKQGKAGVALSIAAISSFIAGTLSLVGLTFFAPTLVKVALNFGPPEYFGLTALAFTMVIGLSGASLFRGVVMALIGFLITLVGQDPLTGDSRFVFGSISLASGINLIPIVVGIFAIGEILTNSESEECVICEKINQLYPNWDDLKKTMGPSVRSGVVGFFLGMLPGCTAGAISFMAYEIEKRFSKNRDMFGKGALEGVAAAEGSNNAATSGGFVPLFSLGLPTAPALAVLLSGLMMYGLDPGPLLFIEKPSFVWAVIASMYIGNVMLLILNLPLVGMWAKLVQLPYKYLAPLVLIFAFIGAYGTRNSMFDVGVMLVSGGLGYCLQKLKYPIPPLVLGLILGPMLEQSFRQSLTMSGASFVIFVTRPITVAFLLLAFLLVLFSLISIYRHRVKESASIIGQRS